LPALKGLVADVEGSVEGSVEVVEGFPEVSSRIARCRA
jgi:hypothetical protein